MCAENLSDNNFNPVKSEKIALLTKHNKPVFLNCN